MPTARQPKKPTGESWNSLPMRSSIRSMGAGLSDRESATGTAARDTRMEAMRKSGKPPGSPVASSIWPAAIIARLIAE
jgi:hypothetical protein